MFHTEDDVLSNVNVTLQPAPWEEGGRLLDATAQYGSLGNLGNLRSQMYMYSTCTSTLLETVASLAVGACQQPGHDPWGHLFEEVLSDQLLHIVSKRLVKSYKNNKSVVFHPLVHRIQGLPVIDNIGKLLRLSIESVLHDQSPFRCFIRWRVV